MGAQRTVVDALEEGPDWYTETTVGQLKVFRVGIVDIRWFPSSYV